MVALLFPPKSPIYYKMATELTPALVALIVYGGFVAVFSIWSFFAMCCDKRKAESGQWRTTEATLHILEFLGGYPGSLLAQQCLRHKNQKAAYQIPFWCIVILHLVLLGVLLYFHFSA